MIDIISSLLSQTFLNNNLIASRNDLVRDSLGKSIFPSLIRSGLGEAG
jgi:hypothetical protein